MYYLLVLFFALVSLAGLCVSLAAGNAKQISTGFYICATGLVGMIASLLLSL